MICSRDIPFLVFFCRTIEVKLQTVFLHTIYVEEGDGDRFARKRLNAFDDGRGETNDGGYAYDDGEHGDAAQQAKSSAGQDRSGDADRKYGGKDGGGVGSDSPGKVAIYCDGSG